MNHPTDLNRTTNEHGENQIIIHDKDSITQTPEPEIPRLWPGSWKKRELPDGLLHSVHEGPCSVWVIPADVIQNVKKVLLAPIRPKSCPSRRDMPSRLRRSIWLYLDYGRIEGRTAGR